MMLLGKLLTLLSSKLNYLKKFIKFILQNVVYPERAWLKTNFFYLVNLGLWNIEYWRYQWPGD